MNLFELFVAAIMAANPTLAAFNKDLETKAVFIARCPGGLLAYNAFVAAQAKAQYTVAKDLGFKSVPTATLQMTGDERLISSVPVNEYLCEVIGLRGVEATSNPAISRATYLVRIGNTGQNAVVSELISLGGQATIAVGDFVMAGFQKCGEGTYIADKNSYIVEAGRFYYNTWGTARKATAAGLQTKAVGLQLNML
jgi:hypothetical protein